MLKKIVKTTILLVLIIFSIIINTKINEIQKQREGKIQILYTTCDSGTIGKWLEKDTEIPLENISTKEIYTMNGWFIEENGKREYVYNPYPVKENLKLYENCYKTDSDPKYLSTIKVIFNNGQPDIEYTHSYRYLILPVEPVKEGYTFTGWVNTKTGKKVESGTEPNSMTIKAQWAKN